MITRRFPYGLGRPGVGSPPGPAGHVFLPQLQGLRAFAVVAVVLYHFWPGKVTGGYVGVDVFFVISGFLITSHLARELNASGTIDLGRFWARRARRLLPASLLVLLFCAVIAAIPVLSPISQLPAQIDEVMASAFYVENWFLILHASDYLAHAGDPTMVQHYWSLSLEEQFYVLWPITMLLAAWIAARFLRGSRSRAVIVAIGIVSLASFTFCVLFTSTDPAAAYLNLFGRIWQFGVGALLALAPRLRVHKAMPSFLLGWSAIAVLLVTVSRFDAQTVFPGFMAAVPTLATAGVIAAVHTGRWWAPARMLALRPFRFLGDISYSLYLWHWPLIVLAPSVPFWGLTIVHRVALVGVAVVLAWLTTRFVENPLRAWRPLVARRPAASLWVALTAMVVVAGVAGGGWMLNARSYDQGIQAIAQRRAHPLACFGAAEVLDPSCADRGPETILPAPGFAGVDRPPETECFVQLNDARPVQCDFGSTDENARRVVLIGDSHAFQLLPTFRKIAKREGWHLTTFFKGACPWNTTPLATGGAFGDACTRWRSAVAKNVGKQHFDVVFTAALSATPYASKGEESSHATAVAGYREAWATQTSRGIPVVAMVDNPVWATDPNKCLRVRAADTCDGARSELLAEYDPLQDAAAGAEDVTLLDFTKVYCDETICRAVVGGADIYRDQDHLTVTFADTLAPQFTAALKAAMDAPGSAP